MRLLPLAERRKRDKKIRELYQYGIPQRRIAEGFGLCQKGGGHLERSGEMIMRESDLKATATEYLNTMQNLGRLVFLRLNAGAFPTQSGRWARGCPAGTADILVIKSEEPCYHCRAFSYNTVIFIELKSAKGKQTLDQKRFQEMVEKQGSEYHIIRDFEELKTLVEGK